MGARLFIFPQPDLFERHSERSDSSEESSPFSIYESVIHFLKVSWWELVYGMEQESVKTDTAGLIRNIKDERTSYGLSVGYFWRSNYISLSYLLSSEWESSNDSTGSKELYSDAVGVQLDVGMNFKIAPSLSIVPGYPIKIYIW